MPPTAPLGLPDEPPPAVGDADAAPELVWVPEALGVADEAGYVEPTAFISKGCDWA